MKCVTRKNNQRMSYENRLQTTNGGQLKVEKITHFLLHRERQRESVRYTEIIAKHFPALR